MERFAVTVISPPGYLHAQAFAEVAETLRDGLRELGHEATLTDRADLPGHRHLVLGANLLVRHPQPVAPDAVLYNLEQVEAGSAWFDPAYLALLGRHTVWDYSPRNAAALRALGVAVARVLPIGYAPCLTRIAPAPVRDLDVLFIGSLNERRKRALARMQDAGLKVAAAFGAYGQARDALIARARVQLNCHFYEAKVLEMVRISYLLANRCAVLSEPGADPDEVAALEGGVDFADYDALTGAARALLANLAARERLAARGFELMQARPIAPLLAAALAAEATGAA
jgi:hypothetical protein